MTDRYTVCRVELLQVGDVIIDPSSGVLAKLLSASKGTGLLPWKLDLKLLVSSSLVSLELPEKRLLRRQTRPGEQST